MNNNCFHVLKSVSNDIAVRKQSICNTSGVNSIGHTIPDVVFGNENQLIWGMKVENERVDGKKMKANKYWFSQ